MPKDDGPRHIFDFSTAEAAVVWEALAQYVENCPEPEDCSAPDRAKRETAEELVERMDAYMAGIADRPPPKGASR